MTRSEGMDDRRNPAVAGLKDLLEQQAALREVAEERARQARAALERVAEALCSAALDRIRKEGVGRLERWPAGRVADFIVDEVGQQLDQVDLSDVVGEDAVTLYRRASAEVAALRKELSAAEAARERAEARVAALERTVTELQRQLATATAADVTAPTVTRSHPLLAEAAALLERAGYQVGRSPAAIDLPDGGRFQPDLKAISPDGEVLWVMVLCDERPSLPWDDYYAATGGHFVVVTADRAAMEVVSSEIAYWAAARPLCLRMTNVKEAQAGQRGRDGSVWLYRRGAVTTAPD